jgi:hypothetical protein
VRRERVGSARAGRSLRKETRIEDARLPSSEPAQFGAWAKQHPTDFYKRMSGYRRSK